MKNDITDWLDIGDEDSEIIQSDIEGTVKSITLKKRLTLKFCPVCGARMHSHGLFYRHPNNQILSDGYQVKLTLIGRN